MPNLPNLGETPDFNTSPTAALLANTLSGEHNAALPGMMQALHLRTGANIIVLDEAQLLNDVVSNPGKYGFVNATDACIDTPACVGGSTATQKHLRLLGWRASHHPGRMISSPNMPLHPCWNSNR